MSLNTDIKAPLAARDYLAAAQLVASYLDPHGLLGAKPSAGPYCAQVDLLFADGSALRIVTDAKARYRIDVDERGDDFEAYLCKLRLALIKSGLGEQGW